MRVPNSSETVLHSKSIVVETLSHDGKLVTPTAEGFLQMFFFTNLII